MGVFQRIESKVSETNNIPEMANARKKTIIIIGAGMAGLGAARQLDFLGYLYFKFVLATLTTPSL